MTDGYTDRGFRVYTAKVEGRRGEVRVQESSRATEGAHVWIFHGPTRPDDAGSIELGVEAAEAVAVALFAFVADARSGRLTEPAEPCP